MEIGFSKISKKRGRFSFDLKITLFSYYQSSLEDGK